MSVEVTGLAHVGIRVHDLDRALQFYALLGYELALGPFDSEPVAILHHAGGGPEINLILNAAESSTKNVLMDVQDKHPGYTHVALSTASVEQAKVALEAAGYPITEGPVEFPNGSRSIFVRDPDRNVIELNEPVA